MVPRLVAADGDWPQWRGPLRDGHAAEQDLLDSWPSGGPKLAWSFKNAGEGYSSCSIVDGRLFTLGTEGDRCVAICLDFQSGDEIWRADFSPTAKGKEYNQSWGGGPRSTPTVDGDQVFVISDVGVIAALSKASGEVQWKKDFVNDFGGKIPYWGYSESALVDGGKVLCTPGGTNFMLGLDRSSGETVWQSKAVSDEAQYVSIMKGTIDSTTYFVTATKTGLYGFDADGNKLFEDTATGNRVAVIPTPIILNDGLYHTSDYGAGNTRLRITKKGDSLQAKSLYHMTEKTMLNHHGGTVLVDGVIYGFSKSDGGVWMAQDLESGETLWREKIRPNRSGSISFADGHLYCYNDKDGVCYLVEPSRSGWTPKGKVELPQQTSMERDKGAIWAHPTIAGGKLIIRDQDLIYAFDISAK